MKHNNLKIYFTIAMTFAVCSIKAQSIQQKFQKDMEQRKNHVNTVRSKANEQQVQQKAERTTTSIDIKPATDAKQNQTGNTNTSTQAQGVVPATKPLSGSIRQPKKAGVPKG